MSREDKYTIRNANTVICISGICLLFYLAQHLFHQEYLLSLLSTLVAFSFLSSFILIRMRQVYLGKIFFMSAGNFVIFFHTDALGIGAQVHLFYFVALLIPFSIFKNSERKAHSLFVLLSVLLLAMPINDLQNIFFSKSHEFSYYSPWFAIVFAPLIIVANHMSGQSLLTGMLNQLEVTHRELVYASRMSSLGEMAGGLAHEINNPLTIIKGYTSMLIAGTKKSENNPAKTLQTLEKIETACQRINNIIQGLRVFTNNTIEDRQPISSQFIVNMTITVCQEKIKMSGIRLDVLNIAEQKLNVIPSQISQVLINLISNSIDAIAPLEQRWIQLQGYLQGENYIFEVTDSGNGFSQDALDKFAQPFFTTKPLGKGTGLGLSVAKGIVESYGGELNFNLHQQNTRISFSIPVLANQYFVEDVPA